MRRSRGKGKEARTQKKGNLSDRERVRQEGEDKKLWLGWRRSREKGNAVCAPGARAQKKRPTGRRPDWEKSRRVRHGLKRQKPLVWGGGSGKRKKRFHRAGPKGDINQEKTTVRPSRKRPLSPQTIMGQKGRQPKTHSMLKH